MSSGPRVVALIGKHKSPQVAAPLLALSADLRARGIEVVIDRLTALHVAADGHRVLALEEIGRCADLAVVIGGDGTMLNIACMLAPFGVPLIGVNQGRLGFLTDLSVDTMLASIADVIEGRATEERRTLLEAEVEAGGRGAARMLAFNDVVLSKGPRSGMVEFEVAVDGRFVYTLRSDGLIVTTPTGSTAYALSSGGPILHPALSAIGLVPISPHTLSNRPIALPGDSLIELRVQGQAEAVVRCDSRSERELRAGDIVRVRRAAHSVRLLHPPGHDYYAMLREKLRWSESPVGRRG